MRTETTWKAPEAGAGGSLSRTAPAARMLGMGVVALAAAFALACSVLTGTALADEAGSSGLFGFSLPGWLAWALPGAIAAILAIVALAVYIIAKAQGSWDDPSYRNDKRRRR